MKRKLTIVYRVEIIIPVTPEKVDDLPSELEQAIYEGNAPIEHLNKLGYDTSGIQHMEAEVIDEPVCRCCGCTEHNACISIQGDPCAWVEDDLCSECVGREAAAEEGLPW